MVALAWVICILLLLFSVTCYIKAKKLERRALVIIERIEYNKRLKVRFNGNQGQSTAFNRTTQRRSPRVKPTRFI